MALSLKVIIVYMLSHRAKYQALYKVLLHLWSIVILFTL